MPSARETALAALADALLPTGAEVWRGTDINRTIPPAGLVEVEEGDAVEEAMLSPLTYEVSQQATLSVAVTAADEPARDAAMDALLSAIAALLVADRTLGGAVDDLTIGSPSFEAIEADGAGKIARVPCTLHFHVIGSPLG
jgi:hypothetical protein